MQSPHISKLMARLPRPAKGYIDRLARKTLTLATLSFLAVASAQANADWAREHSSGESLTDTLKTLALNADTDTATGEATPAQPDAGHSGRIVGGEIVETPVPYMVSLALKFDDGYRHMCGGTIIGTHKVLTAAHCFDGLPENASWRIYHGSNDLDSAQWISADQVYVHPGYVPGTFYNDIAIVRTNQRFNVQPLAVASPSTEPAFDGRTNGDVYGWGITDENSTEIQNTLNAVSVPIQSISTCKWTYGGNAAVAQELTFCAGFTDGGKDACLGDSGGPLVVQSAQGPVQVGIVSFGVGCARPNTYGAYSRVSQYSEWVNAHANGVLVENAIDFGWVLPSQTIGATGIAPVALGELRNNNANPVVVTALDLLEGDHAQFGINDTDCLTRLSNGSDCDLGISLLATYPGRYSAYVVPALSQTAVPVLAQRITAEIPLKLDASKALDTSLDAWYTGTANPFGAATLLGAVDAQGLVSGSALGETSSTLLGIIEGPGTLTFQYQFAPAAGEWAKLMLNGETARSFSPQTGSWRQVTMTLPEGEHALEFMVGTSDADKISGKFHLDNLQYSGANTSEDEDSTTEAPAGETDGSETGDSGGSVWDQILNDDTANDNNAGGDNTNTGGTDSGTSVWDTILGGDSDDDTSTPDNTGDDSDNDTGGSVFDQVLGTNPDDSTSTNGGEQNNATTNNGNGIGQSISNFVQDAANYVVENVINPIVDMIQSLFDQFAGIFNN